jgi:hypothetical protein
MCVRAHSSRRAQLLRIVVTLDNETVRHSSVSVRLVSSSAVRNWASAQRGGGGAGDAKRELATARRVMSDDEDESTSDS